MFLAVASLVAWPQQLTLWLYSGNFLKNLLHMYNTVTVTTTLPAGIIGSMSNITCRPMAKTTTVELFIIIKQ